MSKINNPLQFLLGGKARFNLVNTDTMEKVTYKVILNKAGTYYKVYVPRLRELGDDYIGSFDAGKLKFYPSKEAVPASGIKAQRGIGWVLSRLRNGNIVGPVMELRHLGLCARCGRELTDLESVERGFGPYCWNLSQL